MPEETVGYVELEWTCTHCGTKNPGQAQTCTGCGAPMSDSQKFDLPSQQKLITEQNELANAAAGPDIHCPFCGTRNPTGTTHCSHCGGDLTGGAVRTQGEVLGAFDTAAKPDLKCPYCGTMNSASELKCSHCGAALQAPVAPKPAAPVARKGIGVVPIIILGLVIVACAAFFILSAHTSNAVGVVRLLSWQRSIAIMEQKPVQHKDWKDQVPSDAKLGTCQQQVRRTQDQPGPNTQKVCGTAFTKNLGNGAGQVVQSCHYNVMDDYCDYTVNEWVKVDAVVAKGNDTNPQWPSTNFNSGQREGNRDETYKVTFDADGKSYSYSPHDAQEFILYRPGSRWTLTVNGLGAVTSVTAMK